MAERKIHLNFYLKCSTKKEESKEHVKTETMIVSFKIRVKISTFVTYPKKIILSKHLKKNLP